MTDEQKYLTLLKAIGELIAEKDNTIYWKEYEIKNLKNKLEEAEMKIAMMQKGNNNE